MIKALGRSRLDSLNPYTNTGTFINTNLSEVTTYTKFASGTPWLLHAVFHGSSSRRDFGA
jgi:hypothetical protein